MFPRLRALSAFAASTILLFFILAFRITTTPTGVAYTDERPSYHNFNSNLQLPSTPLAIATFLTGQDKNDAYFQATRLMGYSLLHEPKTRINSTSVTFLVICSPSTSNAHKQQLKEEGATVIEVDEVPLNWWIRPRVPRWREQFTKLRLFEITEYQRILYIDADTMILKPLDALFEEPELTTLDPMLEEQYKDDEATLPSRWKFAARSDTGHGGKREHPVPPLQTSFFSAGFMVFSPDRQVFTHLLSIMSHFHRFDPHDMEQSLLNYAFRRNGPMPWRDLHCKWSATWPNERDIEEGVATIHEKLWNSGPQVLQNMWHAKMKEMQDYYVGY